ncbi:MAG: GerMN domain-containing protein [Ktedonobacterales bacterium]
MTHIHLRRAHLLAAPLLFAALALTILTACSSGSGSSSGSGGGSSGSATATATTATATTAPAATATTAPSSGPYPVKVFFSKHPQTDSNVNAVFAVQRQSPTLGVATFAIQQLIAGPTTAESSQGYFTELPASLSGASNCGGADFVITLNHKGTTPDTGTATLQFCRTTQLAGDLTGGRIAAEITATLTQFPSTQHVVILTKDGSCFNDLSGANMCLH